MAEKNTSNSFMPSDKELNFRATKIPELTTMKVATVNLKPTLNEEATLSKKKTYNTISLTNKAIPAIISPASLLSVSEFCIFSTWVVLA